jgi:hypothetical protein
MVKYSKAELVRAVRLERMELQVELIRITKRIRQIEDRMVELEKADGLLEGEL